MILSKIITCNCRGAGSGVALRHLLLLVRSHDPDVLILKETRVSSTFIQRFLTKNETSGFYGVFGFFGTSLSLGWNWCP